MQPASDNSTGTPQKVPCAGCNDPVDYEVTEDGTYGEWLHTPHGDCYRRTHRDRGCVKLSRAAVDGTFFVPGPSDADRKRAQLAPQQGELA